MEIELILVAAFFLILLAIFYFSAETLYNFHYNLKKDDNPLFKIIGSNSKFIDDKDKWIKHYRLYLILMFILMLSIVVTMLF